MDVPYQLIAVEWVDSSQDTKGWVGTDTLSDPPSLYVFSVGLLVQEDDTCIYLCPNLANDGEEQVCQGLYIPKVCITKMTEFRYPPIEV